MIVKLNNEELVDPITSLSGRYVGTKITVTIDSSKTNSAITVANVNYKAKDVIEISGKQYNDVIEFCLLKRKLLEAIFRESIIVDGGIEDIITKKSDRDEIALDYHQVRFKLTSIYCSFIFYFQDNHGITLEPLNNQAWKSAVLPPHLNKRSVYKGSVDYISEKYPQYARYSNDATDSLCMMEYLAIKRGKRNKIDLLVLPDTVEPEKSTCKFRLFNTRRQVNSTKEFEYNNNHSVEINSRLIANRLERGELGFAIVDTEALELEDIYSYCVPNFNECETQLKLVVKRL